MTPSNQSEAMLLSSMQNPRVKQLIRLRERSERDKSGLFIIEGYRELLRAVESGQVITTLFICADLFLGSNEEALIKSILSTGTSLFSCTSSVFHKISYRDRPDGLVAIAKQKHLSLEALDQRILEKQNPLLIVAEAIEKPGNLGTILRSSDAVGVDALIVCNRCTDIHNPNVVRASVGTLFTVPIGETKKEELVPWLRKHQIAIIAATPSAKMEFTEVDLNIPLAIAVGTEQLGLSDYLMEQADLQVRIPMLGKADSLNVAMATTLLLYEALRQRKKGQHNG